MLWMQFAPVLVLLILGFTVGGWVERRHLRRLDAREEQYRDLQVTNLRTLPAGSDPNRCAMVYGQVVIASDYFKTFAAGLRNLIGGQVKTYQTLMDRARREALLRMKEDARRHGANRIVCARFETSNIGSQRKNKPAMVEVIAYGTAIYMPPAS